MDLNIAQEVEKLKAMTFNELRAKYLEVFGEEIHSRHKEFLLKRIA